MLDKLFRKDPSPNINYGIVLQVDRKQKRVKVQGRNGSEIWAGYVPSEFEGIEEGHTVAIAFSGRSAFLVRRVTDALPGKVLIQEV